MIWTLVGQSAARAHEQEVHLLWCGSFRPHLNHLWPAKIRCHLILRLHVAKWRPRRAGPSHLVGPFHEMEEPCSRRAYCGKVAGRAKLRELPQRKQSISGSKLELLQLVWNSCSLCVRDENWAKCWLVQKFAADCVG